MKDLSHLVVKQDGEHIVVADPGLGAVSLLNELDYVAFHLLLSSENQSAERFFMGLGLDEAQARHKTAGLLRKLERDGWFRTHLPPEDRERLTTVYFTVTRECNLRCSYCYMSRKNRSHTRMSLEGAHQALDRIREINPRSHITVTGGEPFSHDGLLDILAAIEERGMRFSVLSNGTLIDDRIAERLTEFPHLERVQVSVDGVTEKTHSLTRGNSFVGTWKGINTLIAHSVPFCLAPTVHEGNLHEIYPIVRFAMEHGGKFSPNNLRHIASDSSRSLSLSQESLFSAINEINLRVLRDFGHKELYCSNSEISADENGDLRSTPRSTTCGMAHVEVDVNWNGDVYPCHLLRVEQFIMGNVFREDFDTILARAEGLGLRRPAVEIEKCRSCVFVSTCGGGCKADAYFTYGTLNREESLCELLFRTNMQKLKLDHYRATGDWESFERTLCGNLADLDQSRREGNLREHPTSPTSLATPPREV